MANKKYTTWDRPQKNITRQLAQPTSKNKFTLWFPGDNALDVINAKEKNLLDGKGKCKHILVEHRKQIANSFKKLLEPKSKSFVDPNNFFKYHVKPLTFLKIDTPLEYAHFDFCGGLSKPIVNWLFDELKLAKDAEVNFTFSFALRNNKFLKTTKDLFQSNDFLKELLNYQICDINRTNVNDPYRIIAFHCSLIRCLLYKYNFQSLEPVWYSDTVQSMVLYRCRHVSRLKQPFFELDFRSLFMNAQQKIRHNAAIKAHKTRNQKKIVASDVVSAIIVGETTKKPARRAVASRMLRRYVAQQKRTGKKPHHVEAAIKAAVTRRKVS